mmetsp:Transcript_58009/g.125986  ORF Transcript_58009/g.125986 Transcript_58009/m.125986 type:complete len:404 (-) Transcript_58009:707-1918(-)
MGAHEGGERTASRSTLHKMAPQRTGASAHRCECAGQRIRRRCDVQTSLGVATRQRGRAGARLARAQAHRWMQCFEQARGRKSGSAHVRTCAQTAHTLVARACACAHARPNGPSPRLVSTPPPPLVRRHACARRVSELFAYRRVLRLAPEKRARRAARELHAAEVAADARLEAVLEPTDLVLRLEQSRRELIARSIELVREIARELLLLRERAARVVGGGHRRVGALAQRRLCRRRRATQLRVPPRQISTRRRRFTQLPTRLLLRRQPIGLSLGVDRDARRLTLRLRDGLRLCEPSAQPVRLTRRCPPLGRRLRTRLLRRRLCRRHATFERAHSRPQRRLLLQPCLPRTRAPRRAGRCRDTACGRHVLNHPRHVRAALCGAHRQGDVVRRGILHPRARFERARA